MFAYLPTDDADDEHGSSKVKDLLLPNQPCLPAQNGHQEEEQEGESEGGLHQ